MITIKENVKKGTGFDIAHEFEGWKIAYITSADQYGELKVVKRHVLTDEVFVLLCGEAILYTADGDNPLEKTVLEKDKLYVVEKNTWHHLKVSDNALILVIENSNTNRENTESKLDFEVKGEY